MKFFNEDMYKSGFKVKTRTWPLEYYITCMVLDDDWTETALHHSHVMKGKYVYSMNEFFLFSQLFFFIFLMS